MAILIYLIDFKAFVKVHHNQLGESGSGFLPIFNM